MFLGACSRDGTRALAREILMLEPADYAAAFKGSAIKRAKLWMLQRNACVVLGNIGTEDDVPALIAALRDEASLVRGHAAWALGRLGSAVAVAALRARLADEPDVDVREEISCALRALDEFPVSISK